jgi:D-glycero-beta-D-manno-heptose 1-phosphate adenylyltransferase
MIHSKLLYQKIFTLSTLQKQVAAWRLKGKTVAFTNGCFDIVHPGHIASLTDAAKEADYLVVAVNSSASVSRLKGPERPINTEDSRCTVLAAMAMVDAVVVFDDDTPLQTIVALRPDVLVKGGDYTIDKIVGAAEVQSWGGKVVINPLVAGFSTTSIIQKIHSL